MPDSTKSIIETYYSSLESRIGYRLLLGGTRHFGYYASPKSWPWPITPALRAMEAKLLEALQCKRGSKILDAGCGVGHVALYVARMGGLLVEGIDLTPHHIVKARKNIQATGMSTFVSVRHGDYHKLENFDDADFDGIYTMETLVHSTEPRKVLCEFLRLLKPGGCLVMHEYDHVRIEKAPKSFANEAKIINSIVGMPAFETWEIDGLEELAREVGFEHVQAIDMSKHIVPMLWLFYVCAYIPYLVLKLFGLQYSFINTTSAISMYKGRNYWRYVQVRAIKSI